MCWRIEEYLLKYGQGLKIPVTYLLENKPRVTFLVIGDSLVIWHSNYYKKNYFPTRSVLEPVGACHSRFANEPAGLLTSPWPLVNQHQVEHQNVFFACGACSGF